MFAFLSGSMPMGVIQALVVSYSNEWKDVPSFVWVSGHLPHLYVGFALSYMALYLVIAPYKLYRELEAKAAADKVTLEKENQEWRRLNLEGQSKQSLDAIRIAEEVGKEYARIWRGRNRPGPEESGKRFQCLLDSGICKLEHVPDGLNLVIKAAQNAGATDPFVGLLKENLFAFFTWAVTRPEGLPPFDDEVRLHEAFFGDQLRYIHLAKEPSPLQSPWAPLNTINEFSPVVSVEYHPSSGAV